MDSQKFEIDGLKEVIDGLSELPVELQRRIIRSVLSKAGRKFIVSELRSALPYSARLKESLRVVNDPNDKLAIFAGVGVGKRIKGEIPPGVLIRFLDKGTVQRHTKKGYNRGTLIARNSVPLIIDSQIQPIIDWINNEFGNEIEKILQRKLKRINKV
jgi:hypothetical protein